MEAKDQSFSIHSSICNNYTTIRQFYSESIIVVKVRILISIVLMCEQPIKFCNPSGQETLADKKST